MWDGDWMIKEARIGKTSHEGNAVTYVRHPDHEGPLTRLADGQVWHYVTDHLGTPQEMYDQDGEIVWAADFSAYGLTARSLAQEVDNPIRFPGQYHDEESGLHYNRHRYYDPNVGRYITKDPIGLMGGMNSYAYVNGNPVQAIDPLGLKTGPVLLGSGNVYRASAQPPLPALSRNTAIEGIYGDVSNLAFRSPALPGEWVGVNVPWSMPTIRQYCAKGYFGDSPLGTVTDNSGGQCRRQQDVQTQSIVPEGWSDRRKFTCTEWVPYDSAI
jgi:type VI secretion system secreted protein VgrG